MIGVDAGQLLQEQLAAVAIKTKPMAKTDFNALRHKAMPKTTVERDFVRALNMYVYHKLRVRRLERVLERRLVQSVNLVYHRKQMADWRELMDRIEFGLDYWMPTL